MQNSSYGFGDMFDNRIDNGFYVNEARFSYRGDDIDAISFHIASDNRYFVQGIAFSLDTLKQQHKHIDFGYTFSNGTARSTFLITKMIREKHHEALIVIIASAALLNMLSLSLDPAYMDKVIFVATSECNAAVLAQIADSPHTSWAVRDKYFPQGMLAALSNREKRICYYLFCGYTPKMIGTILGINIKTVSSYRVSVMKKIGCSNKIDLYKTLQLYYGAGVEG